MNRIILALLLTLSLSIANAAQPLVTPNWLEQNKQTPNLVLLDLQDAKAYQRYHIPGAVNTQYADWRVSNKGATPQMMTPVAKLEKLIGSLGIDNQSHVLLITTGASAGDMAAATRIYWTFKALGLDEVSILDGGLVGYAQLRRYPLEQGNNRADAREFKANPRPAYMPDANAVKAALEQGAQAVDNRNRAEYLGIYSAGGRERPGSLPKAVNLNYEWLTVNGGGQFQSIENLKKIYAAHQVPLEGPQINYCHTGHRASLGWFVSHELLGNQEARLYDGSTAEWATSPTLPMEQKVELKH